MLATPPLLFGGGMIHARRMVLAFALTVTLVVLAWEWSFDLNDPTIPLVREFLFTAGSILGICAFLYELLDER